jgi:hypothetical protein
MSMKKAAAYAVCENAACKTRFRKWRDWQQYCSKACNEKARRQRAEKGVGGIPVPAMPDAASAAPHPTWYGFACKIGHFEGGCISQGRGR